MTDDPLTVALAHALGSTGECGHSSCPRDTSRHLDEAHDLLGIFKEQGLVLRAEPSRSSPDPDWIDHLPGVTAAFGVTFGELMVPVSAIREHFAAASRLGSSPDLTGLDPD